MSKKKHDPIYVSEDESAEQAESKVKKVRKQLKQTERERKEYLDGWQRERAEFANYKKDIEKHVASSRAAIHQDVLGQFLPIVDNLELALKHTPAEISSSDYGKGIEQIVVQARQFLKQFGVEEIMVKKGDVFNPAEHEAVDGEGGTVAQVVQKGYTADGTLLRPAKVKVSKK